MCKYYGDSFRQAKLEGTLEKLSLFLLILLILASSSFTCAWINMSFRHLGEFGTVISSILKWPRLKMNK